MATNSATSDHIPADESLYDVPSATARSSFGARLLAFVMLGGVLWGVAFLVHTTYLAVSDSFVAPATLSPDSDIVLASKVKLGELDVERARAVAELEGVDSDLAASANALQRLETLHDALSSSLVWTKEMATARVKAGAGELRAFEAQNRILTDMLARQDDLANRTRTDVEGGLLSRSDLARELQVHHELQVAVLENQRSSLMSHSTMREAAQLLRGLSSGNGTAQAPEAVARQEQTIRVELEATRLESEVRSRRAQKHALEQRIAKIEELSGELKARPLYRATLRSIDVAFVPYTQIDGVAAGARVYSCVWGLFACEAVGTITEMVPGEVLVADPWGDPARGQYAVLSLTEREAARSKTLRVRGTTLSHETQAAVSSR